MADVLRSLLGPVGVWGHLDSLAVDAARDYAARVESLGFGALWVPETVAREPFVSLAGLAAATSTLALGTSIANIYARDAVTTSCAAMTLHEATGGRFVLGLGVSHPHLVTKVRQHRYERPVPVMREYLEQVRRAPYRGPHPADPVLPEPPIVLAALREGMTRLAATASAGAFPYLVTPERVAWMRGVLDLARSDADERSLLAVTLPVVLDPDAAAARERARAYLTPYLRAPNYQASFTEQGFEAADLEPPGSDRLVDAMVTWGGLPDALHRIAEMRAAGADHVAVIPLGPDDTEEHLPTLEAIADRLP